MSLRVAFAEMIALTNLAFATTAPEWTKWWLLAAIGLQLTMVGALALPTRDGRIWEGFVDPEVLRRAEEREPREKPNG